VQINPFAILVLGFARKKSETPPLRQLPRRHNRVATCSRYLWNKPCRSTFSRRATRARQRRALCQKRPTRKPPNTTKMPRSLTRWPLSITGKATPAPLRSIHPTHTDIQPGLTRAQPGLTVKAPRISDRKGRPSAGPFCWRHLLDGRVFLRDSARCVKGRRFVSPDSDETPTRRFPRQFLLSASEASKWSPRVIKFAYCVGSPTDWIGHPSINSC
jgi:hypothetical protein